MINCFECLYIKYKNMNLSQQLDNLKDEIEYRHNAKSIHLNNSINIDPDTILLNDIDNGNEHIYRRILKRISLLINKSKEIFSFK